jgi:hypothetical protein
MLRLAYDRSVILHNTVTDKTGATFCRRINAFKPVIQGPLHSANGPLPSFCRASLIISVEFERW